MKYTVKHLANISGVSTRTLHWYDRINLLKPSFCGENGYRYYEKEQLLALQQILFFREFGFSLKNIQELLVQNNFDKVRALRAHKAILENDIKHKKRLISTIGKTIFYLENEKPITDEELYEGLNEVTSTRYEQYLIRYHGTKAEKLLIKSKKRISKWNQDEWSDLKKQGDILHKNLANMIDRGFESESLEVQKIISQHYQLQGRFFNLTKELYRELSYLYEEHPDFKKIFETYHPKMIEFLSKAIRFYADNNL